MNDFRAQWADVSSDVLSAVQAVGESGFYVLGEQVRAFEGALAKAAGVPHVIGCASGLDGLEIALRLTRWAAGTKVITTPLSAFATTLAIVRAGGVPVFVDVDESGLLDLDVVEALVARDPSVRHVLPVHLYGHALDLERLARMRGKLGLWIVEDLAQALCARFRGIAVGSVGQANATSFYPTKNLGAMGDGGAVLTSDLELVERAKALRDYGQTGKYKHELIGLNSRLDEVHAAILARALLPRLARWTATRRAIAERYRRELAHPHVQPLPAPSGSESVWHLFPVRVPDGRRDSLIAHLKHEGILSAVHYPVAIPDQPALAGLPFECVGELPRARALCRQELSIPIHPYLTDAHVGRVIAAINAWRVT